jgi:hypothetical protein
MSDTAPRDVAPASAGARPRRARAPINTSGGRATTPEEFRAARLVITRSGLLGPLKGLIDGATGRKRSLSVEGFLVAKQVNGLRRHHQGHLAEIARTINGFTDQQRDELGIIGWDPRESYDRTDRFFNLLADALEQGSTAVVDGVQVAIDSVWYMDRFIRASLHDLPAASKSQAVDWTDVRTWARFQGSVEEADLRARLDDDEPGTPLAPSKPAEKRRRARVLGRGADGRPIYTKDLDARGGHHSATGSRDAGEFVGYDLHLAVQARDAGWADGIERLHLGPDVPPVITMASLVPAGTRPDDAVVPKLIAEKDAGLPIEDLIWDRGYSQLRPETTSHPLNKAGIHQTFRPKDPQRIERTFSEYASLIEGHLVSTHAPEHLRRLLPMPPMNATIEETAEYERAFNELARYRFERLNKPDADGTSRWKCPFHAGRLRTRAVPETMRASRDAPLIDLPDGERCCDGTVSVQAAELPHWQRFLPGTTAWRTSYGRRQVVEGANGMLKGGFANIAHKFFRVLGLTKMRILLAATIVGHNLEAIRSFVEKKTADPTAAPPKRTRKKRRKGTWTQILESPDRSTADPAGSGRAPPPT